jgi:trk system potassium uptake protein
MRSLFAVIHVLGSLLMLFGALFVMPTVTALVYGEALAARGFLLAGATTLATGALLWLGTRRYREELKARDGYLLVTLGWLLVAGAAAMPLLLILPGLSFTGAYFEAMSGLTTTGSTILTGLDSMPHAVNLWRCALHWLGGMGVLVLAVAVLPLLGVGGMQVYRADMPGAMKDAKLTPRITQTAKMLGLVYCGMSIACIGSLLAAGMSGFDAICHGFSVISLGGFSTHDRNIAWFDSPRIEVVMSFFMIVAAVNFSTHFAAIRRGDLAVYRRDPEARWMVTWIIVGIVMLTGILFANGVYPTVGESLRRVGFSLITLATTSGFTTVDYSGWPLFVPMWMLFMSCVASCTGSTGGGIKVFRALVLIKQSFREMFVLVHPQAVSPLKIAGAVIQNRVVYSVLAFIFVYFMSIVVLTFAMLLSNLDFISALTAVLASINNTGPGLGIVGPTHTYAGLSDFQTWVCTAAMFLGRIELFTALVLFTPVFWRK